MAVYSFLIMLLVSLISVFFHVYIPKTSISLLFMTADGSDFNTLSILNLRLVSRKSYRKGLTNVQFAYDRIY